MILGDYIDFGRPFPSGFRGLAAQFFRDRSDGDWDYFPRGFGEPGYRVNATMRQKILDQASFVGRYIRWTVAFEIEPDPVALGLWWLFHFSILAVRAAQHSSVHR